MTTPLIRLKSICSPESAGGLPLFAWLDSPTISRSGPPPALVSPSASPDAGSASRTSATSGPTCSASSVSAALQDWLESRLRPLLAGRGSPLYALTWKRWDTPSAPSISALRASAPRISASGSIGPRKGWVSPMANDAKGSDWCKAPRKGGGVLWKLPGEAKLAGWATASARDWKDTPGMATEAVNPDGSRRSRLDQLPRQAALAGWSTPLASEGERSGVDRRRLTGLSLAQAALLTGPMRMTASGEIRTGSSVETGNGGRLNPAHSRWLMGFPAAWDACAPTETPSSRKSRRRS